MQQVMQVPPQVLRFSSQMKHHSIVLSENNTRAIGVGFGGPLVVVEPSVSSNTPCRAVFKINSIDDGVFFGVCLPNSYESNCKFDDYAVLSNNKQHGTLIISNYGDCFTHGNPDTLMACSFTAGQSVAVEWQSEKLEVWW